MKPKVALFALLTSLLLVVLAFPLIGRTQEGTSAFASPLPTPFMEVPISKTKATSTAVSYVLEIYGLPPSAIYTGYEEPLSFPMLQREAIIVPVFKVGEALPDPYRIFVDAYTGEVIENPDSLYEAERKAYDSRYGKLDPALYDRMDALDAATSIPVAIWLATPDFGKVEADLKAEVSARYPRTPEEQTAGGDSGDAREDDWAEQRRAAYLEGLSDYMEGVTSPVVLSLATEGIEAMAISGMPLLAATLTDEQIHKVAERADVETIYPDDGEAEPALNLSVPSERVRQVWNRRLSSLATLSGAGVAIAILESFNLSGPVVNCLNMGPIYVVPTPTPLPTPTPTPTSSPNHKNIVAAAAACDDAVLRGPGFGSTVVDVAHRTGESLTVQALQWAIATPEMRRADIVNQSEQYSLTGGTYDRAIHLLDRAYDYWIFQVGATAIAAAGNQGTASTFVTTPGKAYNVITVGNIDDGNTIYWSNDSLAVNSSWLNPANNLEKPEIVAYGSSINTVAGENSGTSFAAPQVSGIAALLMERDATLKTWPSAIKAILMASAVHNVDGVSTISPVTDDKDGVGAVDAALADTIAQNHATSNTCDTPCYWTIETVLGPLGGSYSEYTIHAIQGEHIRVVVSWLAHASGPSSFTSSALWSNYDLYVKRPAPDNTDIVLASTEQTNNYDIQEFTAPYTGVYRIVLHRTATVNGNADSDASNYLAIAWGRQAAYAPDIRNDGAWTSSVYLRSDEPTDRDTFVVYRDDGGASTNYPLVLHPNESVQRPPFGVVQGAAVINGHEDLVSVYGMSVNVGGLATLDNVFRPPGYGDPAFEQVSATLYLPALYRAIYGNSTSVIDIQNVGSEGMQPTLRLFGRSGYGDYSPPALSFIPPGGHLRLDLNSLPLGAWAGSGHISATQPLAVRVLTRDGAGRYAYSYNAAAQGTTLSYTPVGYRTSPGLSTALVIQNTGTEAITPANSVTLTFRNRQTQISATRTITQLASLRTVALNASSVVTNGWSGSITIDSRQGAGGVPVVALVVNTNADSAGTVIGSYATTAVTAAYGGRLTVLPYAVRNINGRNTGWTVRNINGLSVDVTARYYDSSGSLSGTRTFAVAAPGGTVGYAQGSDTFLPTSWQGSIVLESTGAIVAVMREDGPNTIAGYNGVVLSQ